MGGESLGDGVGEATLFCPVLVQQFLGQAGTLAALGGDAERVLQVVETGRAFMNGFADLVICHPIAKTNVHDAKPSRCLSCLAVYC